MGSSQPEQSAEGWRLRAAVRERSGDERTRGFFSAGLDVFGITGGERRRTHTQRVFAERRADAGAECGGVSRKDRPHKT
ncbi:hypothetical protein Q5P01_020805 [Channa striata]|uniref:Uncharacterized protein n=1 Tax=Channa striata TaxID=64152 RepID=A0AA88LYD9_CHASR|nr:hypothetical protein Q5P01_020805 [Channa striata]